jgi:NAD(P)H-dependent FMN reductase
MSETTHADLPTVPTAGGHPSGEPLRIAVITASVRDQRMGRALAEWAAFRTAGPASDTTVSDKTASDTTVSDKTVSGTTGFDTAASDKTVSDTAVSGTTASGTAVSGAVDVDLIDCAECDLPDDGQLRPGGSAGTPVSALLAAADAYVFVTPEYNHSYPAPLKRLIDWHYREWMFKPATVLSYGVNGGLLATEHLRGVFAELHMVTTRRVVGLPRPWNHLTPAGYTPPSDIAEAFDAAVHELTWWAGLLRTARHERPYVR